MYIGTSALNRQREREEECASRPLQCKMFIVLFAVWFLIVFFSSFRMSSDSVQSIAWMGEGNNFFGSFFLLLFFRFSLSLFLSILMIISFVDCYNYVGCWNLSGFKSCISIVYNACQANVKYYCSTSLWNRQIFILLSTYGYSLSLSIFRPV